MSPSDTEITCPPPCVALPASAGLTAWRPETIEVQVLAAEGAGRLLVLRIGEARASLKLDAERAAALAALLVGEHPA